MLYLSDDDLEAVAYVADAADALAEELTIQGVMDDYLDASIDITYALLGLDRAEQRATRHATEGDEFEDS